MFFVMEGVHREVDLRAFERFRAAPDQWLQ
jgi:hypothetical protein